jgi:hypothetical protein
MNNTCVEMPDAERRAGEHRREDIPNRLEGLLAA